MFAVSSAATTVIPTRNLYCLPSRPVLRSTRILYGGPTSSRISSRPYPEFVRSYPDSVRSHPGICTIHTRFLYCPGPELVRRTCCNLLFPSCLLSLKILKHKIEKQILLRFQISQELFGLSRGLPLCPVLQDRNAATSDGRSRTSRQRSAAANSLPSPERSWLVKAGDCRLCPSGSCVAKGTQVAVGVPGV